MRSAAQPESTGGVSALTSVLAGQLGVAAPPDLSVVEHSDTTTHGDALLLTPAKVTGAHHCEPMENPIARRWYQPGAWFLLPIGGKLVTHMVPGVIGTRCEDCRDFIPLGHRHVCERRVA